MLELQSEKKQLFLPKHSGGLISADLQIAEQISPVGEKQIESASKASAIYCYLFILNSRICYLFSAHQIKIKKPWRIVQPYFQMFGNLLQSAKFHQILYSSGFVSCKF